MHVLNEQKQRKAFFAYTQKFTCFIVASQNLEILSMRFFPVICFVCKLKHSFPEGQYKYIATA